MTSAGSEFDARPETTKARLWLSTGCFPNTYGKVPSHMSQDGGPEEGELHARAREISIFKGKKPLSAFPCCPQGDVIKRRRARDKLRQ